MSLPHVFYFYSCGPAFKQFTPFRNIDQRRVSFTSHDLASTYLVRSRVFMLFLLRYVICWHSECVPYPFIFPFQHCVYICSCFVRFQRCSLLKGIRPPSLEYLPQVSVDKSFWTFDFVNRQISEAYSRTAFTFELNIRILVFLLISVDFQFYII